MRRFWVTAAALGWALYLATIFDMGWLLAALTGGSVVLVFGFFDGFMGAATGDRSPRPPAKVRYDLNADVSAYQEALSKIPRNKGPGPE